MDDDERSEQVRNALLKALAVVVGIGVVIALGTTIMVRALGLNEGDTSGPVDAAPSQSSPLPTTALPVPSDSESPSTPESSATASSGATGKIQLQISPVTAHAMQRVNLTGSYKGADNVPLEVQRFQDGTWQNFGVQTTVRVGTFATYVMTGRQGENRFRMFDPSGKQESNVILVTIQ